ncbi:MAG: hypothetical protein PHD82_05225 [Candidatus Riflebacteria bacterium]|nr:hypothetical protein [Candidatus Riflebacteria bacterium]
MNEIETPVWVKYAGDIFYLLVFLVILFFVKPDKDSESNELSESPNPLEVMLLSDDESHADENFEEEQGVKKHDHDQSS